MKKIVSVLMIVCLLFLATIPAFADTNNITFEKLFASELPQSLLGTFEYEAGEEYVLYVSTPRSQEPFEADGGSFEGVRGTIVKEDIIAVNANIISVEEDDDYDYLITFSPKEEGEFSLSMTMRTFGFDIIYDDYRTIEGDDWVYTIKTETYTALPSSKPVSSTDDVSSVDTQSNVDVSNDSNATSSVINIDADDDSGVSFWVLIILAVAVVVCAVVVIVLNKKKLIK